MQERTNDKISSIVVYLLVFTFIAIIIAYIINNYFIKQTIIKPLENLNDAIIDISQGTNQTDEIKKKNQMMKLVN